jgi:type III pantothenate kinase
MWLLIDIGNSAAKVGLFDPTSGTGRVPGEVIRTERFEHVRLQVRTLKDFIGNVPISRAAAVSVVPQQRDIWSDAVRQATGVELRLYTHASVLPIDLAYRTPATMGHDRIAAAVGAWTRYAVPGERGVLVLDAGTALNIEVVRPDGIYPGGVIAAGPAMVREALGRSTAQLPLIPLELPPSPVGTSTDEALQSGILYSLLDAAVGMVARIQRHEAVPFTVVTTGGWGAWMIEQLRVDWIHDRHLVLKGVADLIRCSE